MAAKAGVPGLLRKSGADAVKLDLSGAGDVRRADEELAGKFAERLTGVLVQPMVTDGTEVIIGVVQEPVFGPLVVSGLGGVATKVLSDHSAGLAPLTGASAGDLIRSVRAAPLLPGRRGAPAAGLTALSDTLLRVSQLADDLSSRCDPPKQHCRDPADPAGPRIVCAAARQRVRAAVPADQGGGAAGAAPGVLRLEDRGHHRAAGCRMDRLRRGGQLVVAAGGGRVPGGGLHPDRVPGPRRRAPADFRLPAGQLRRRRPARQPRHRAELRLVGRQAQPPPRAPQHRGRGP